MDWLTQIGSLSLPWYVTAILVGFTILCMRGVPAYIAVRRSNLEERQYDDTQHKAERDALVEELKARIDKLEKITDKQSAQIEVTREAHVKCEIESERLRGRLSVAEEKIARLEQHDRANKENVEKLKAAVIDEVPKTA